MTNLYIQNTYNNPKKMDILQWFTHESFVEVEVKSLCK